MHACVRPQDVGALRCQVIEMVLATDMTKVRPAAPWEPHIEILPW
jgi:hypothetical protein